MPDLQEGQRVTVQGSGVNQYVLARDRAVYSCSCPAWRNMRLPIVQRRCKHLVAYLQDVPLETVAPTRTTPRAQRPNVNAAYADEGFDQRDQTRPPIASTTYDETPDIRDPRDAALKEAIDSDLVLFDKMEEVYGLRLPREVAYAVGFYLGLRDFEKADLATCVTRGPIGIGAWWIFGALEVPGDLRLRDRAPEDPPEIVPVFSGLEATNERFVFLYDEPSELPSGLMRRFVSTGTDGSKRMQTALCRGGLLDTLRDRLDAAIGDRNTQAKRMTVLAWLDEVIRRKEKDFGDGGDSGDRAGGVAEESSLGFQSTGQIRGGLPHPYVPGWRVPEEFIGPREHQERLAAYAEGAASVDRLIERADLELSEGSPGRALFLGRELHMHGGAAFRAKASELLIRSYAMLGRNAFADLVRAHHLELHPTIDLYEPPPPHAIVLSAAADDAEGIKRAWAQQAPNETDIEEAFKRAASVEVFDAIFEHVDDEARDRACRVALGRRVTQLLKLPAQAKERHSLGVLIGRFIDRSSIDARTFERIVETRDNELATKAAHSVDLASRSQGATPLHIVTRAVMPDLAKILIDRGADVRAKNARGRMAFDDALTAPANNARDAHQIMLMLEAAGGAIGKVPTLLWGDETASQWVIGDKVHHAKFGDGVVLAIDGNGDDAKLQINFAKGRKKDLKTLLSKFVTRV